MPSAWPTVPLGDVLSQYREYIESPGPGAYPKLSVKLYGKGVVLDAPADGATLKMKRHQLAKAGQVVLSEIWGKKGAIGLVPSEGDGALCTSHFYLFDVDRGKVEPGWLRLLFAANYLQDQLSERAKGTTGYAAVRPGTLLAATIPLPPVSEQRRIVARIDELAAKIEEARGLQNAALRQGEALCRSMLFHAAETTLTPMRDLVRLRETDVNVTPHETYQFAGVYSFGRGMFRGRLRVGSDFAYRRLTRLRAGNFTYPKLMAWEGALSIVPPEYEGFVVSPEFPVFEIDTSRVLEETLDTYFRTPSVWPEISASSTGTNVRRRRLHPETFLKYKFPLPSMESQQVLRDMRRRVDGLKRLQSQAQAELDALLPSALERAFRGEL